MLIPLMVFLLLLVWAAEEQRKGLEFIIRDFPLEGAQRPKNTPISHYSQRCRIIFAHLHHTREGLDLSRVGLAVCIYSLSTQEINLKVPVEKSPFQVISTCRAKAAITEITRVMENIGLTGAIANSCYISLEITHLGNIVMALCKCELIQGKLP